MRNEIDCKRFYLDSQPSYSFCPHCDRAVDIDYLSYPVMNEWFKHTFYCSECDEEFEKELFLKVELTIR